MSVGRREVLTPSLLCPVLASISCRARTDRDCSSTKLQIHRSGGTYCRRRGERDKEGKRKRGERKDDEQKHEPPLGTNTTYQDFVHLDIL